MGSRQARFWLLSSGASNFTPEPHLSRVFLALLTHFVTSTHSTLTRWNCLLTVVSECCWQFGTHVFTLFIDNYFWFHLLSRYGY